MGTGYQQISEPQTTIRFKINPGAIHRRDRETGTASDDHSVELKNQIFKERHKRQNKPKLKAKTPTKGYNNFTIPLVARYAEYDVDDSLRTTESDEPLFQKHIYFFNVIVALEWQPTKRYLRQLRAAFQNASDFLYDVTDGYMAFGQVVIGGMELMECADIQIMASNRFHPRSWVNGLNEPTKYTPIRVGRGIWHKNRRVSIPWDEPEGYRALVHEWAHYALGLRDEYLEKHEVIIPHNPPVGQQSGYVITRAPHTLIIPSISLATESIMGSLEGTSELVPQTKGNSAEHRQHIWAEIQRQYPRVDPQPPRLVGPHRLPIGLPSFPILIDNDAVALKTNGALPPASEYASQAAQQMLLDADGELVMTVPINVMAEHCWVYVVKGSLDTPTQVVAQGTLDARSVGDGFRLLNAKRGDYVVLIGKGSDERPIVLTGEITGTQRPDASNGLPMLDQDEQYALVTWHADPVTPQDLPLVDMQPMRMADPNDQTAEVQIHIAGQPLPDTVWLFPLGQQLDDPRFDISPTSDQTEWQSEPCTVASLDGHLYLRWNDEKDGKLAIYTFSQGGGPATHVASQGSPITAGSSEGNVMLFFKNDDASQRYGNVRVVTTLIHDIADAADDAATKERSYTFSIASNEALPTHLTPTLIMYYDTHALRDGGDLLIHRLDGTTWVPMPSYLPPGASFAAMPLNKDTAPQLIAQDATTRIERFRLFWTPRNGASYASTSAHSTDQERSPTVQQRDSSTPVQVS